MARGHRGEGLQKSREQVFQQKVALSGQNFAQSPSMPIRGASHGSINKSENRLPAAPEGQPTEIERRPSSPNMPVNETGPLDFFNFTECMRNPCETMAEAFETVPANEEARYVTRTFHWRPEDFPIEDGTYMQCDEPWESEMPPHRTGERAGIAFKAGKAVGRPYKVVQHTADADLDDMLDDEEGFHQTETAGNSMPSGEIMTGFQTSTTLIDLDSTDLQAQILGAAATSEVDVSAPAGTIPAIQPVSIQAVSSVPDWCADFSTLAPPPPQPVDSKLVVPDVTEALFGEVLPSQPGGCSPPFATSMADTSSQPDPMTQPTLVDSESAFAQPLEAVVNESSAREHVSHEMHAEPRGIGHTVSLAPAFSAGAVNSSGLADAPLAQEEVAHLREQLQALKIENETLKAKSVASPGIDSPEESKAGFIV